MRTGLSIKRIGLVGVAASTLVVLLPVPGIAYQRPGRSERVSVNSFGLESLGSFSIQPSISANSRFVAFGSDSSTLVSGDTNGVWDIFLRDRGVNVTERISISSSEEEANGPSSQGTNGYTASLSADGRYVAFTSSATNLVGGDTNGATDVFIRDRQLGQTHMVSLTSNGGLASGASSTPSMSADGRYVAFVSAAVNVVPGDTNGAADVFIRDRELGTTSLLSRPSEGVSNAASFPGVISADGRHVAFVSAASNLVAGDTNATDDIFVRDLDTAVLERISVATDHSQSNGISHLGDISADGRFVVFRSDASNLVPGDTNGIGGLFAGTDVFVRDRVGERTERASIRSDGEQASAGVSLNPTISDDGRYVVFESEVTDLVNGDTNDSVDVFVYDRLMSQIERASINSAGAQGNSHSSSATSSSDGRHVSFSSEAADMVAGDTNGRRDNFVRDRGPDVGVGDLVAAPFGSFLGPKVTGSGWATFTGVQLAADADPIDGAPGAADAGGELVGASIAYRAEQEDLLIRLDMRELSPIGGICGKGVPCPVIVGRPGTMYGFELSLADGTRFEVRSMRAASSSVPPSTPYFGLYRCQQGAACVEVAKLKGGIGTGGEDVRVAVPLSGLGIPEGSFLTGLRAFTAVGEASSGAASQLDEVSLGSAEIPSRTVFLGVAGPSVPLQNVAFTTAASLERGAFSATLSASNGSYRLWAKACLGPNCSATSVLVGATP